MLKNYQSNYKLINYSDKETIFFLHGFIGNLDEFDEVIKLLGTEFSYLTVDLSGHGKTQVSSGDKYYTIEQTAQVLINLLDELNIPKCFLVGYSMGGRLALYLTLHFPGRFYKVVLESASPGLATETERLERVKKDAQIARKLCRCVSKTEFREFLLNWYTQPIFGYIKNHPEFERILESRLQNQPIELAKSLRLMGTGSQPSLWGKLKDNIVPLLLLVGDNDQKFLTINTKIAELCKVAQLKIISNSAHNTHLENTREFVQNIKDFFDKY
ncbi:2-succinyl-6-hydroxy-2,4-cyclohexadiene-1-carboxylate synthase [Fortiea sp. LEGE XX443]|uniref:2-succinyl-6-hydroxy-2, 4-cyclohexadiene-1-carboxylate synthase n=1 Tax=Fortiea sp. LEGE XX443 TaxID=1828611 RepID=UPI00187F11B8|nr:2-succinyl-6-hydroxy-2,4-cyclohexadiene-1-carboxylate synthase [Fortiea sp. LEGE XX443]MBE9007380.1 2-succinyl-6-hydroxy-2,4-cyclohexadiene-1-carboxylate synthase [Fortiea sp. LEGE XX443]